MDRIIDEPGHFVFTEQAPHLEDGATYNVGQEYIVKYRIENKTTYDLKLSLEAETPDEICLKTDTEIRGRLTLENQMISFTPRFVGEKKFKLLLKVPRLGIRTLLDKTFHAENKPVINKPKIETQVKRLPTSMKLGQKAEISFLFTNLGNQAVSGINIKVEQIEA